MHLLNRKSTKTRKTRWKSNKRTRSARPQCTEINCLTILIELLVD